MGASAAVALKLKIYDSEEELALVRQAKAGDEAAFTALFHHHFNHIRAVISRIIREDDTAEWLANVALTKVWQKLASFDEQSKFSTWITRIAINEALMHMRRQKSLQHRLESSLDEMLEQLHDHLALGYRDLDLEGVADRQMLKLAISRVPQPYRDVLRLRFWEGLSLSDIKRVLGEESSLKVTLPAIKSRLSRGRKLLMVEVQRCSKTV